MSWQLKQKQSLPLEAKIILAKRRIKEWYEHWDGDVYVAFSGGKDSTVLLDLVRSIYPEVPAVFVDTGLEFPEIKSFVKTIDNVVTLKPKIPFPKVIEKYGYPVVSKEQSQYIDEARNTNSDKLRDTRLNGNSAGRGKVSDKWKYLLDAPFKISDKCCDVMKKRPSKAYEKATGRKAFVGTMAVESQLRLQRYNKSGCNSFTGRAISAPLSVWTDVDIWEYIKTKNIRYSVIYDMGEERTGCMFCLYGCHKDNPNRFQKMAKTHPKIHNYCMDKLGIKKVLAFMSLPTGCDDDKGQIEMSWEE